jgi:hypothetical protein
MRIKGFIFTLDALFALVVASAGVSILLYAYFVQPLGYQIPTTEAYSIMQSLLSTTMLGFSSTSLYASAMVNTTAAHSYVWPQYAQGGSATSGSAFGPQIPTLLFQFIAAKTITSTISVTDGLAVFAAGNSIYALNATTGNVILNKTTSANVLSPLMFQHTIIYANSTNYITGISYNGLVKWRSGQLSGTPTTTLTIIDNYLAFASGANVIIMNPLNGQIISTTVLPAAVQTPNYLKGEFIFSTADDSPHNYVYAYLLNGSTFTGLWTLGGLPSGVATFPSIFNNYQIVEDAGGTVYSISPGGIVNWSVVLGPGGVGASSTSGVSGLSFNDGSVLLETATNVIEINITTPTGWSSTGSATGTFQNISASSSPYALYTEDGNTYFDAYTLPNNTQLFSIKLSNVSGSNPENIALAYGNAYLSSNNTFYAFGTCGAPANQSVLQAIATFYVTRRGGCGDLLLSSFIPSVIKAAIMINDSYAPALQLATFNGKSSAIYSIQSPTIPKSYTVSMWLKVNKGGPIVDMYSATKNNGIGSGQSVGFGSYSVLPSGGTPSDFSWSAGSQSCTTPTNSIKSNLWYNVVGVVVPPNTIDLYINGNVAATCGNLVLPVNSSIQNPSVGIGVSPLTTSTYANGSIADVQLYSGAATSTQTQNLYSEGLASAPLGTPLTLLEWYPLDGDANDYSDVLYANPGLPFNVTYTKTSFYPLSLTNAYEVSKTSTPLSLGILNSSLYNVSVVVWR